MWGYLWFKRIGLRFQGLGLEAQSKGSEFSNKLMQPAIFQSDLFLVRFWLPVCSTTLSFVGQHGELRRYCLRLAVIVVRRSSRNLESSRLFLATFEVDSGELCAESSMFGAYGLELWASFGVHVLFYQPVMLGWSLLWILCSRRLNVDGIQRTLQFRPFQ